MVIDTIKKVMETYTNLYFPDIYKKKSEKFDDNGDTYYEDQCNEGSCYYLIIMAIVSWLVTGFAVYLSFKCSNGFGIGEFLLAIFFAPFYILYHLIATKLCGMM